MNARWLASTAVSALLAGCAGGAAPVVDEGPAALEVEVETDTMPPTSSTSGPVVTSAADPTFASEIRTVTEAELGLSWRARCPVAVEELRWVDLTHWDSETEAVDGALIVHADHAEDVVAVFARLFAAGFPVQSMRPITEFDSDNDVSMAANNTSAFTCREISGRPGQWSQHAYGGAIDVNPLVNPWVRGSQVDPPAGAPFVDRTADAPGLIVAGDVVTQAFADIGWGWGGDWTGSLDYQHFSHDGR